MTDYAQRLAAHPRWVWHIGCVTESSRVYDVGKRYAGYEIPDIHHPATRGWLLEMLREAHGETTACARWPHQPWSVMDTECGTTYATGTTEGEALAAALLAVWGAT